MKKTFKICKSRKGRETIVEGTIEELTEYFIYTLEVGRSYQHEKGNKKINMKPKTIKSLVSNLNNAVDNAACNGCGSTSYREA